MDGEGSLSRPVSANVVHPIKTPPYADNCRAMRMARVYCVGVAMMGGKYMDTVEPGTMVSGV